MGLVCNARPSGHALAQPLTLAEYNSTDALIGNHNQVERLILAGDSATIIRKASMPAWLPQLGLVDFTSMQDHVIDVHQNGKVCAFVHRKDLIRSHLARLTFNQHDLYNYVFIHGGVEHARFENMQFGTHEIPQFVVAQLLGRTYGAKLNGMQIRMCTCYGNLLRPGETGTAVGGLAALVPTVAFEGYHGLVYIDPIATPPRLLLSNAVGWDPVSGPYFLDPPVAGCWEPVIP